MAVKTKAQILADITAAIPDNNSGAVTPAVMRTILTDLVDSLKAQNEYIQFDIKSSSFTPIPGHHTGTIDLTASLTIQLPDGYPDGYWFVATNIGTGQIDFSATNPIQMDGAIVDTQWTSVVISHRGGDVWRIEGRTK